MKSADLAKCNLYDNVISNKIMLLRINNAFFYTILLLFINLGSIPPNSVLEFEVVLDDTWISPFKFETTFKPEGCDRQMRKTYIGDTVSIAFNGTIDRNDTYIVESL